MAARDTRSGTKCTWLKCLHHIDFKRSLECHYGLLDELIQNGCLTTETVKLLKQRHSVEDELKDKLIDLIDSTNIDKFIEGLRRSNQAHLANYITKNGGRKRHGENEWPLSYYHIEQIQACYADLIRDIYINDLIDHLFEKKCINDEQKNEILNINFTPQKKNRALLNIMTQRSIGQLEIFVDLLRDSHPNLWEKLSKVVCFRSTVDVVELTLVPKVEEIGGVAVVGDEIFVLGWLLVWVYDSHSLRESRYISIPGMKSPRGFAGCAYNRALYISDWELECIHRVDLTNDSVTRWEMRKNYLPLGLSVTTEHTLLVTVQIRDTGGESRVVEYTSEGQQVRKIRFDRSITWALHTVQLSSDQFIVSHGDYNSSLHRVCVINAEGQIIKSFGREAGRGDDQLNEPRSIAIDEKSKNVFVADRENHRVLMLDLELMTRLGEVHVSRDLYRCRDEFFPTRLYFDSSTDRLFVAVWSFSSRLFVVTHPELDD